MAVTIDTLKNTDRDQSSGGVYDGFALTASDVNYIENPAIANQQMMTKGISLNVATAAISVVMANGQTRVIPAGQLAAGVIHPIQIKRLNATGTGVVTVWGWF